MSRAFIKEDAAQPDEDPPERPLSPHPNYVTPRGLSLLQAEEERLLRSLEPLSGTQADSARRRKKRELERDLRYVRARLESAIPVDPAAAPAGEIRFGARVTLRRADGAESKLAIVGEDEAEAGAINGFKPLPWPSPLANALLGLMAGGAFEWQEESTVERWSVSAVDRP